MFTGLKPTASLEALPSPQAIDPLDLLIPMLSELSPGYVAQMQRQKTRTELVALIAAIETHGFSRALLSFVDHDGTLRAAIPSLPALESLTTDLSAEDSADILTALKALTIEDVPAEERLTLLQGLITILLIPFGGVPAIIAFLIFTGWNADSDMAADARRKNQPASAEPQRERIASVVPYNTIVSYLQDLVEVPGILTGMVAIPLPKTVVERAHFQDALSHKVAPLNKLGIHVTTTGQVSTTELATPVHGDITKIGYTEHSLKNIAELAQHIEAAEKTLKALPLDHLERQKKEVDGEELKFVTEGLALVTEVLHASAVRMIKIVHLAKHTCQSIEHFYAKG